MMIKFTGYIKGIEDVQAIIESLIAIVEAAGGAMFSVWDECDDEEKVRPTPLASDAADGAPKA